MPYQHSRIQLIVILLAAFGFCGTACGADPLLVFDLAAVGTEAGKVTRVHGSSGDGRAGTPVCGGFDCDGDGIADCALASIQADPLGRPQAGEIVLVFGDGTIGGMASGVIDTEGFSAGQLKIVGAHNYEVAGAEIWMADVTGDGLGDLLIGRQNASPDGTRVGIGALTILVGGQSLRTFAAGLTALDLADPPMGVTMFTLIGDQPFDRLGIWMRTGDVDGDGIDDIAVGADNVDSDTESNRGAVYVIRGGEHLNANATVDLADFGGTSLAGKIARVIPPAGSSGYHFGSTTQIADMDGNGRAEVMACAALSRAGATIGISHNGVQFGGAFVSGSGGSARGTLYIVWDDNFPVGDWPAGYQVDLESPPGTTTLIDGGANNRAFGEEMIGGFDLDGDGRSELVAGDLTAFLPGQANIGSAHVFMNAAGLKGLSFDVDSPPAGLRISLIHGTLAGSITGDTVAAGDFDGDGLDDLAVGNPHDHPQGRLNAGSVHVLYGQQTGWPAVVDLSLGNLPPSETLRIARIDGARGRVGGNEGDVLCYSLAVGDMNADGHPDLIVNEMVGDGVEAAAEDVGNLLLVSGAALLPPPPRIQNLGLASGGADVQFEFLTISGKMYQLQSRETFGAGQWSDIGAPMAGVGGLRMATFAIGSDTKRFYRVVEQ